MESVQPGRYRHFKGGLYEVVAEGRHSETEEWLVVYRAADGGLWIRPREMFLGTALVDGVPVRRFTRIEEGSTAAAAVADAERSDPAIVPSRLRRPHGSGDAWVEGPDGRKYWGTFGAAGLLVFDRGRGILLQHRATWSHFGGTWGLPGGARHEGETAVAAALREAEEEAGVPAARLQIVFSSVLDLGFWSYTTVVATVVDEFEAEIGDAESLELRWIAPDDVASLPLHPGFAASWPRLWAELRETLDGRE
jgi:8-oxo-dGTP pyrophosphatase MutT (NUDIX family)